MRPHLESNFQVSSSLPPMLFCFFVDSMGNLSAPYMLEYFVADGM